MALSVGPARWPVPMAPAHPFFSRVSASLFLAAVFTTTTACEGPNPASLSTLDPPAELFVVWRSGDAEPKTANEPGSSADSLPFEPTSQKLVSTAMRTWIYTDTGPRRTRLGYLRAGQIVDARGPALHNDGCAGGWYRINPRGFVCLGLGASLDLESAVAREALRRPERGRAFPYTYALSGKRPPHRYFRLPSPREMARVEGAGALAEGRAWLSHLNQSGALPLPIEPTSPLFLSEALVKPYGAEQGYRTTVHAGRASKESAFAILGAFEHEGRAFGLTTDFDLIALDRTRLVTPSAFHGVELKGRDGLRVGFHLKGALSTWELLPTGRFRARAELREKQTFELTSAPEKDGMLETSEGFWVPKVALRLLQPRSSFPSFAVGNRKWIDVSIRDQALVAYEGTRPIFATLVSTGRGELGDPDRDQATVRGTFMIFDKSVSSTMDGEEDRADSFDLRDVPFVQYFHKGFALHGAYWHDDFGRARSHGCVNLAARDAAFLFEWTDPQVPATWHSAINKERGTVVVVRP
jgi:hypothetical protein